MSYRVATRRKCLRYPHIRSTRFRSLYSALILSHMPRLVHETLLGEEILEHFSLNVDRA